MPEENKNVAEVIQPQEGSDVATTQTQVQDKPNEERPTSEEKNWKEVREIMQHQKRKIAELEEKLQDAKPQATQEEDPLDALSDEDVVTVADAKKMVSSYAKKIVNESLTEAQKKQAYEQVPSQFGDFPEVIKLVDEYVKENPAAEAAILASPNPRLTAYQLVKSSSLFAKRTLEKENSKKIDENSKKPVSSQTIGGSSPFNEARSYEKMTGDRAKEIRRLAEEYASRR